MMTNVQSYDCIYLKLLQLPKKKYHDKINLCPSLTFWVQLLILAILRIWYRLKGLCLKNSILKTERKYSFYLCQYHHFEVKA